MTKAKSAQRVTAQRKLELYLATGAPVGEILRECCLHLHNLREIEQTVEGGALCEQVARPAGAAKVGQRRAGAGALDQGEQPLRKPPRP